MRDRVLITGGAGFLGSHLCTRLLKEGHFVTCLDDFSTGRQENIEPLLSNGSFLVLQQDVCSPIAGQYDQIYNLACPASLADYTFDPFKTIRTCVHGVMSLLELAKKNNAVLLHASTSEVYGDPLVHPQKEDYFGNANPVGPRACYVEGKRCSETLCAEFHRVHGANVKIARIFNTYGPNMRLDGRVIGKFAVQALQNIDITIQGDGSQTRSFCYVEDLIEGLIHLMNSREKILGPVNLGNPEEITIRQLAEQIIQLTGSQSRLSYLPLPLDDPKMRKPNIQLAMDLLDWKPTVSLEAGLQKTLEYFQLYT
jgi:UDP-glucuronate decarboxylase